MTTETALAGGDRHIIRIIQRRWLTKDVFILTLERPTDFHFTAGQRVRLHLSDKARDYSVIPGDHTDAIELLIRTVTGGSVSRRLSHCPLTTSLAIDGPSGHFIFRPSPRPPVFVATGTGIAPFAAMARSGVTGFILLHGVREPGELYYHNLLAPAAGQFVPCLTNAPAKRRADVFPERVTRFLQTRLVPGEYDFYLAGRREMIADAISVIDDRFPSSRVYTEIFF